MQDYRGWFYNPEIKEVFFYSDSMNDFKDTVSKNIFSI